MDKIITRIRNINSSDVLTAVPFCILFIFLFSGFISDRSNNHLRINNYEKIIEYNIPTYILDIIKNLHFPQNVSSKILKEIEKKPSFVDEVFEIFAGDPSLWILIDRDNPLTGDYKPDDLVELKTSSYIVVSSAALKLREGAAASLKEMADAAVNDNVRLYIYSAYRSFSYQTEVFARNIKKMGKETAEGLSARPGHSEHQLGLAVDFYSFTEHFNQTAESEWLIKNASNFGWSLSYPESYDEYTGYSWESWHYRYVGKEIAKFIDDYFNGVQQYALMFLKEYFNSLPAPLESNY